MSISVIFKALIFPLNRSGREGNRKVLWAVLRIGKRAL